VICATSSGAIDRSLGREGTIASIRRRGGYACGPLPRRPGSTQHGNARCTVTICANDVPRMFSFSEDHWRDSARLTVAFHFARPTDRGSIGRPARTVHQANGALRSGGSVEAISSAKFQLVPAGDEACSAKGVCCGRNVQAPAVGYPYQKRL
jgi:hypothetical protein